MQMKISNTKRIPTQGNIENLFERLALYISWVDKDWINRIEPASDEAIDKLRIVSGLNKHNIDFPKAYNVFKIYG